MHLLDTNICIDFIDGRSEIARDRVRAAFRDGLHLSSITLGELLVGARASADPEEDQRRIDQFVKVVRCHQFDEAAARSYAVVAKTVAVRRKSFDRLIAAHALALDLILVTSNEKHFADVPGLKIENWTLA